MFEDGSEPPHAIRELRTWSRFRASIIGSRTGRNLECQCGGHGARCRRGNFSMTGRIPWMAGMRGRGDDDVKRVLLLPVQRPVITPVIYYTVSSSTSGTTAHPHSFLNNRNSCKSLQNTFERLNFHIFQHRLHKQTHDHVLQRAQRARQ